MARGKKGGGGATKTDSVIDPNAPINLASLQRTDESITRVLHRTGHVVVYQHVGGETGWATADVEGPLFIVTRSTAPTYALAVLNRLSVENWITYMDSGTAVRDSAPYVIVRTTEGIVYGIWFPQAEDRAEVARIASAIKASLNSTPAAQTTTTTPPTTTQSQPVPVAQAAPSTLSGGSGSVDKFFASFSNGGVVGNTASSSGAPPEDHSSLNSTSGPSTSVAAWPTSATPAMSIAAQPGSSSLSQPALSSSTSNGSVPKVLEQLFQAGAKSGGETATLPPLPGTTSAPVTSGVAGLNISSNGVGSSNINNNGSDPNVLNALGDTLAGAVYKAMADRGLPTHRTLTMDDFTSALPRLASDSRFVSAVFNHYQNQQK